MGVGGVDKGVGGMGWGGVRRSRWGVDKVDADVGITVLLVVWACAVN